MPLYNLFLKKLSARPTKYMKRNKFKTFIHHISNGSETACTSTQKQSPKGTSLICCDVSITRLLVKAKVKSRGRTNNWSNQLHAPQPKKERNCMANKQLNKFNLCIVSIKNIIDQELYM